MFQGQHLRCQRNNVDLFGNITFSLKPGQCLQVRGPNGSGKSSLLKLLVGLLPSQSGKLLWERREIRFPDPVFLNQVKYLGHKLALQDRLSAFENLTSWFKILGSKETQPKNALLSSIEQLLKNWGLLELGELPSGQLSQGQRQRVALARLELIPAKLWVLDEPCTALDNQAAQYFKERLECHLQKGGLAIVVSHTPLDLSSGLQHLDLGGELAC